MPISAKEPLSAVALGMFDGMHIGHRQVIRQTVEIAKENGWQSVVYTFLNHPRQVFGTAPAPLMSVGERERIMRELGVDRVDMVAFDRETAAKSPEQFLKELSQRYRLGAIVCGSDYTFGCRGAGTVDTLREHAQELGYLLCVVPFVMLEGKKVSSSRIREALKNGEDDFASRMLGR